MGHSISPPKQLLAPWLVVPSFVLFACAGLSLRMQIPPFLRRDSISNPGIVVENAARAVRALWKGTEGRGQGRRAGNGPGQARRSTSL